MNSVPPSTPFAVPGLDHAEVRVNSPESLLLFLRSVNKEYLDDNLPRIPASNKDNWIAIVNALADELLRTFPLPDGNTWDSMGEKIELVETTLEVSKRVFRHVNGIYNSSEALVKKLLARSIYLCGVLDLWIEVDVPCGDQILHPADMKERAIDAIVSILRGFGDHNPLSSEGQKPSWKILREMLQECLDICNDFFLPSSPLASTIGIAFFRKPRIINTKDQGLLESEMEDPLCIMLSQPTRIPLFLVLILEVMVKTISPRLKSQWHLSDIIRSIVELSRTLLFHCLGPAFSTTVTIRTKAFMNILSITKQLRQEPEHKQIIADLIEYSLHLRLESRLALERESMDRVLAGILKSEAGPSSLLLVHTISRRLQTHKWKVSELGIQSSLWTFLGDCLPYMDDDLVLSVRDAIEVINESPERDAFLRKVSDLGAVSKAPNEVTGRIEHPLPPDRWKQGVQDLVQEIITPDTLSWMDDDLSLPHFCKRALHEIQARFEMQSLERATRLSVVSKLSELPCLLARCSQTNCLTHTTNNDFLTVGEYLPLIRLLIEGAASEASPEYRRKIYFALGFVVKHHSGLEDLQPVIGLLFGGIIDVNRSVRLSAGHALSGLVQFYGLRGKDGFHRTEHTFTRLYQCFEESKNFVRETLLTSVGLMGKTDNSDVLGQVVCLLVAQLQRQNPVIRGTAAMQILSIAKHHRKTPYSLILPYMDQVAPYVIKELPLQPHFLRETCRIMSIAPDDFILISLPRTLPELFATCDQKVIDAIAKELETKVSTLLIQHSPGILARMFLLPSQASTTKALNFIIKTLTAAAPSSASSSPIDVQSVVKSCLIPLLAELVVVLGDEHTGTAQQAKIALQKVETTLLSSRKSATSVANLTNFLKTYILGLISTINDMLQDVQGKKSVEMKRKIIRSLGALVEQIGESIVNVAPQIMATFQTMVSIPELSEVTLESWHRFLVTLHRTDLGPQVGPTSAAIVTSWAIFSARGRDLAFRALEYIVSTMGHTADQYLAEIVDLSVVEELQPVHQQLVLHRGRLSSEDELERLLSQSASDNLTVAAQALRELKTFMLKDHKTYMRGITSGDMFDPNVGRILACLLASACRDSGDGSEGLRLLAFECLGVLGAMDPDRCEIPYRNTNMVVMKNFMDDGETVTFALHLIQDLLVGAFRSTSDITYQSYLAYSIQELLKICQFTPALVATGGSASVPLKVRNRWNALPKHVLETVTPLLDARFTLKKTLEPKNIQHPIYPQQSTYREWIQLWTNYLITKASGSTAARLFGVFSSAVRNKDVIVAHHLLPHLVLNILISGNEDDALTIRTEILTVLEDQVDVESSSTSDKKLLSAQAIFMLLDHLSKWMRVVRQEMSAKKSDSKRLRPDRITIQQEEQLLRLDSILANIDQNLMAKAAFQCKAFARALMNFEQQILVLQERGVAQKDLAGHYEKLHEIYAHLDEPDGMEGISTLILSPSLEHQIRQHESTGRWTAAQSCWEVRLQESPDNVEYHLGLLRCLRNLGHYDTLRTHVAGVLTRHPDWERALADFQVESAWMVGAWDDIQKLVSRIDNSSSSLVIARVLLAMRNGDQKSIYEALSHARSTLGGPIIASGVKGYRHSYEAVLDLHRIHELEIIHEAIFNIQSDSQDNAREQQRRALAELSQTLSSRLNVTLPTFRTREPLLSMRRTAFSLSKTTNTALSREIGKAWLSSAKIARKAKQWQTAYSATLQAKRSKAPYSFIESAKLLKASGEPLHALLELENSVKLLKLFDDQVLDLTVDAESERMKAKIQVLRARWMNECDRFDVTHIYGIFTEATTLQKDWESAHYYLGQFHDDCFRALSPSDQHKRGLKMNNFTVRCFSRAILHGSKFVYRTIPRLLTIWLDVGEDRNLAGSDTFKKMTESVAKAISQAPVYKWFTAFPQIVSRVAHDNGEVYKHLKVLIATVLKEYPKQALWLFTSVVKSTKINRATRGNEILNELRNNPHLNREEMSRLINESLAMTDQLLALCDYHIDDHKQTLSMSKDFPKLKLLGHSNLIIPLQESLTASLPPVSAVDSVHQPFPVDTPTFHEFFDEIDVMRSLARPRKISIRGSNGQIYMFLGKPKDDLRKDARLMDFNAIINKLLKGNSESRRRQLHIRTYGVVTLNEECGLIQWVPNTTPIRPVLIKYYDERRIKPYSPEMTEIFKKIKEAPKNTDINPGKLFQMHVLSIFKPVFHEWFIETFPEPTAWLASRLTFARTAAVMSMVGFILGLGDRHCENILLDNNTGDVVHVDFNCLFEKGKALETPERVPFRLTQNIIDGFGVSGVEGVFRISCEVTLQLLRDNKDSLMSVLDAFVHDPLVEWEDEKRKLDRNTRGTNASRAKIDTRALAKSALIPIEKKLQGIYTPGNSRERHEKQVSTSNLVELLIQEATDLNNLARMYPGWAAWH